jgi:hypothetical protein
VRFSGLLTRAIPVDESTVVGLGSHGNDVLTIPCLALQFRGALIDELHPDELHPMELILIWRDRFQCFGASRRDRSERSASGQQSSMMSTGTIRGSIRVAVRVGLVTMKTPEIL